VDWAQNHWWQITLIVIGVLLLAGIIVVALKVYALEKSVNQLGVTNLRDGFPEHIEAAWEDVGAHGRFLTDLGGMSIKMREQLVQDFFKALHKPISSTPPAGSIADILIDVDRDLTRRELQKDDKLVLVQRV